MNLLMLLGAALITINPPASDLVTRDTPYRLAIEVTNTVSVTQSDVRVLLSIQRVEPGLKDNTPLILTISSSSIPRKCELVLPTTLLAEGEYAGEVQVQCGDVKTNRPISFFR